MAVHDEVVLRSRLCRGCTALFFICTCCDRGHAYCGEACRTAARRRQRRAANGRYQTSEEGRLDHRDRQREYRRRQAAGRVTDQGSLSGAFPAFSGCGEVIATAAVIPLGLRPPRIGRCSICGRPGRFVDPFPRIPLRR